MKTREEIIAEKRSQIIKEFNFQEEEDKEKIDKLVKKETDLHDAIQGKKNYRKQADDLKKAKEYYKKIANKAKETKSQDNQPTSLISADDKAYLYAQGYTRTELRYLEKVMKATGKTWDQAKQDNLFSTWQKENEKLIKRRGSMLPASRGGSGKVQTDQDKMVQKFSQNLPKGFSADGSKK